MARVITGSHLIMYAEDADATRAFLRDVLGLHDVDHGDGWLIFRLPPGEIGVHPADFDGAVSGRHELYLHCDDIDATMGELRSRGAEFGSGVIEQPWGRLAMLNVPGGGQLGIYQPLGPVAYEHPVEQPGGGDAVD
jgi:catechol 2,3-dioxygenase-like lactoylglutathione lyase family enzyme